MWVLMVSSVTTSVEAIPRFECPATSSASTSDSRWVRPWFAPGQNSPDEIRAADIAIRPASAASIAISPSATRSR